MDKREEIPQWALDKAMGELAGPGVHVHSTSYAMVVDRFAVALSQARSQAYEHAASMVEDLSKPFGSSKHSEAVHFAALNIAKAIRQHSQNGGENE